MTPPASGRDVLEHHLRVGVGEGQQSREPVAGEVTLVELHLDAFVAIDADRDLRHETGADEGLLLPVADPRVERRELEAHVRSPEVLLVGEVVLPRRDSRNRMERRVEPKVHRVVPNRTVVTRRAEVLNRRGDRRLREATRRQAPDNVRRLGVGCRETRLPVIERVRARRGRREVGCGNAVLGRAVGMDPAGLRPDAVSKRGHCLVAIADYVLSRCRRRSARRQRFRKDLIGLG